MTTALVTHTIQDVEIMAKYVVESQLFGMKTIPQATALMLLCQAKGMHPMEAVEEFHIIQGRHSMKAERMLAKFQAAGGKVQWHELSDALADATFSHPSGGSVRISWDIERAKRAGLAGKEVWKAYGRAMLRSRVISEGVKTVLPGVAAGVYTPEEVIDLPPEAGERDVTPAPAKPATGVVALQARVAELAKVSTEVIDAAPAPAAELTLAEAAAGEIFSHSDVLAMADRCADKDDWLACLDMARGWTDEDKKPLRKLYSDWKKNREAESLEAAARG